MLIFCILFVIILLIKPLDGVDICLSNSFRLWFYFLIIGAILSILWSVKNVFFVLEMGLTPEKNLVFLSSLGCGLLITGILLWRNRKAGFTIVFILYTLATLLLYADLIYQRYYHAIIRIELLAQARQLGAIKDSIYSLMHLKDIWYFADLPLLALCLFILHKKDLDGSSPWIKHIFIPGGIVFILTITFCLYKPPYSDQYKVSLAGIIPAHIYDLSSVLYKKIYLKETFLNEENLTDLRKQFLANHKIQKSSPYFGNFKGKNIIMVQAESLNTFPIGMKVEGQEVTPNLNALIKTSMYYPNTFLQIGRGNTSDAEFVANNSIYPMGYVGAYKGFPDNNYPSLGNLLIQQGYSTSATHGNSPDFWNRQIAYKNQGFQEFYHIDHPEIKADEIIGMGISDDSIFNQMIDQYRLETKPFYNFIVTLTNHRPFEIPSEYRYLKLSEKFTGTPTGNYIQSVRYFDEALGKFIIRLKEDGLWDKTIFVVYGDHYGPLPKDAPEMKKLLNINFNEKERFKIPLIIHHPGQTEGITNKKVASQMDIFPTITSLLGIEKPLIQFGTTVDAEYERYAGFAFETTRYSFYSDQYDYRASHKGVFEDGTCIDNKKNQIVDVDACRVNYNLLSKNIHTSTILLEHNFIESILNN
jgi:lipoteichoic acid synthase